MADKIQEIIDYLTNTPENTNPNVVKGMLESLQGDTPVSEPIKFRLYNTTGGTFGEVVGLQTAHEEDSLLNTINNPNCRYGMGGTYAVPNFTVNYQKISGQNHTIQCNGRDIYLDKNRTAKATPYTLLSEGEHCYNSYDGDYIAFYCFI